MSSTKKASKPAQADWDSMTVESELQRYLKLQGKTLEEFEAQVEEARNIHELEAYNAPKSTSDAGTITPPEGWVFPRYNGHPSKWRRLTDEDRAIAESLTGVANENLSIHLYNVQIVKNEARARNRANGKKERNTTWPRWSWTNWPMKPKDVPRRRFEQVREGHNDDDVLRSLQPSRSPVEDLQAAIIATFLKQAKEKFLRRTATVRRPESSLGPSNGEDIRDSPADINGDIKISEEDGSPMPRSLYHSQSEKTAQTQNDARRPKRKRRDSSSTQTSMDSSSSGQKPILMADDDKATALLAPIARHVLSRIDKLLAGLHRQRKGDVELKPPRKVKPGSKKKKATSDNPSTSVPIPPSKRPRPSSFSASQRPTKRSKTTRLHSSSQKPPRVTSQSSERDFTLTKAQQIRIALIPPRDWRPIIGVAAMTEAFPQQVIKRAFARCASLFGKGTTILPDEIWKSGPREEGRKTTRPKSSEIVISRPRGLFCSVEWCKRSEKGFSRVWNLNKHMKEIHGLPTPKKKKLARQEKLASATKANRGAILAELEAEDSDYQIEDGVHVDGYLQEIRRRPGQRKYLRKSYPKRGKYRPRSGKKGDEQPEQEKNMQPEQEKKVQPEQEKNVQTDEAEGTEESDEVSTEEDEEEEAIEYRSHDNLPAS